MRTMKNLFTNPKVGQKVILNYGNDKDESVQRIVEVTSHAIRISSCNLYKFNRDGTLNKRDNKQGLLKLSIRPTRSEY